MFAISKHHMGHMQRDREALWVKSTTKVSNNLWLWRLWRQQWHFSLPALNAASAESGTSKKKNKPLRSATDSRLKNIDIFLTLSVAEKFLQNHKKQPSLRFDTLVIKDISEEGEAVFVYRTRGGRDLCVKPGPITPGEEGWQQSLQWCVWAGRCLIRGKLYLCVSSSHRRLRRSSVLCAWVTASKM